MQPYYTQTLSYGPFPTQSSPTNMQHLYTNRALHEQNTYSGNHNNQQSNNQMILNLVGTNTPYGILLPTNPTTSQGSSYNIVTTPSPLSSSSTSLLSTSSPSTSNSPNRLLNPGLF